MFGKAPLTTSLRWTLAAIMLLAAGLLRAEAPGCGVGACDQTCPMHRPTEPPKEGCCPAEKAPPKSCECGIEAAPDHQAAPTATFVPQWPPAPALVPQAPPLFVDAPAPTAEGRWPECHGPPGNSLPKDSYLRGPPSLSLLAV